MMIAIPLIALALIILYRRKLAEEWTFFRTRRREWAHDKWKNWGEPFLIAGILAILIRTFLVGPYKIPTGSMRPTFMEGDRIFVDKISYRFHPPQRGDIIVFKYPIDRKKDFVKRLAGLSSENLEIREGKIFINGLSLEEKPFSEHYYYNRDDWTYGKSGQVINIPEKSFFAMGDNSAQSSDSRSWGFVPAKNVVGKAFCIWWPPKRIKLVK